VKERRLSAEEAALWARVVATVEPLKGRVLTHAPESTPAKAGARESAARDSGIRPAPGNAEGSGYTEAARKPVTSNTLDGSWDRKLTRGTVAPDLTVDLHGHTLDTAYRTLDAGLEQAVRRGARVLLLVTGKPRDPSSGRGAIRAAVGDWLAASRHSADISAVRGAHPRHGGTGALYIILKRPRPARTS
jgi:DNA-nicking Smr family endonuclease